MSNFGSSPGWVGRNHVSSFVHSLHLLDLDQRQDWPGVSVQSFGVKSNLQHRTRCVEWSLYRLFELYDPRSTKDKLRPFFPPTTSLQSVNLRAALLRQLTDLKKDGLLGPNIVLRKTMLDECKGDKFEELLAAFSLIVLNKIVTPERTSLDPKKVKRENVVPLILSLRKGIQRHSEERKELELRARQQLRSIDSSIEALSAEAKTLQHRKAPETPENADLLKQILRENWIGDYAWIDTILRGVAPGPSVADMPITELEEREDPSKLLTDLDSRVEMHNARLARWQTYLKDLHENHQEPYSPVQESQQLQQGLPSHFTRHLTLETLNEIDTNRAMSRSLNSQHTALLEALDGEMNQTRSTQLAISGSSPTTRPTDLLKMDKEVTPKPSELDRSFLRANSTSSDESSSSQKTQTANLDSTKEHKKIPRASENSDVQSKTPPQLLLSSSSSSSVSRTTQDNLGNQSLSDRTRASLAQFDTPKSLGQRGTNLGGKAQDKQHQTVVPITAKPKTDRTSLLERTRQSMSMLTNVLDDSYPSRRRSGPKKPTHTRSKTVNLPSQRPRLERAWSEESLASVATKEENIDLDADYESVFMSRPRLAMSPNLSPQRTDHDLWLETQLEEGMNKLTINSSPEESRVP